MADILRGISFKPGDGALINLINLKNDLIQLINMRTELRSAFSSVCKSTFRTSCLKITVAFEC